MFPVSDDASDLGLPGEPPELIMRDVINRPRPQAKIIAVSHDESGVGKSTIAFTLVVALANVGLRVAAVDLDPRQRSLMNALARRDAIARRLAINLPAPQEQVSQIESGAMLCDELRRLGGQSDVVVIDGAENDSGIVRRTFAIADAVLTPISGSIVGLDPHGKFAQAVNDIRQVRRAYGLGTFDWVVVQNRVRHPGGRNHCRTEAALEALAPQLGFRIAPSLADREAYRELFQLGLIHLDLGRIPQLPPASALVNREIVAMLAGVTASPSSSAAGNDQLASLPALTEPIRSSGLVSFFQQ